MLGDPVGLVDPTGKAFWIPAIIIVVGTTYVVDQIKDVVSSATLEAGWKKSYCNSYKTSKNCLAAFLALNSTSCAKDGQQCIDYSKILWDQCKDKNIDCGCD